MSTNLKLVIMDHEQTISAFISSLPVLSQHEILDIEDSCPICLTPFQTLIRDDSSEDYGVTKLACSHLFCRKDLLEWIRNLHGSCPTCRTEFMDIHPPGSDDGSSDGGEYMPSEDGTEEEDSFMTSDFDMDLDSDDIWERSDADEMQAGVDNDPSSDGDNSIDNQEDSVAVEVNVSITEEEDFFDDSESDEIQTEEPK